MKQIDIEVIFSAPVERLFDAWHRPDLLLQWIAPGDMQAFRAFSNFSNGGRYEILMMDQNGMTHEVNGHYDEIEANRRLRFSWHWQGEHECSQVELLFDSLDEKTSKLMMTHRGLLSDEAQEVQQMCWLSALEKLSSITLH